MSSHLSIMSIQWNVCVHLSLTARRNVRPFSLTQAYNPHPVPFTEPVLPMRRCPVLPQLHHLLGYLQPSQLCCHHLDQFWLCINILHLAWKSWKATMIHQRTGKADFTPSTQIYMYIDLVDTTTNLKHFMGIIHKHWGASMYLLPAMGWRSWKICQLCKANNISNTLHAQSITIMHWN